MSSSEADDKNIGDIFSLQKVEKEMLDDLENNTTMSDENKKQLIDKINAIFNMRIDLYKSIGKSAELYKTNFNQTNNTLLQQTSAIDIEERRLNDIKYNLKKLKDKNFQELRLVQINNYYNSRYNDHIDLLKTIGKYLALLIINQIIYNIGIIPNTLYWIIVVIISIIYLYNIMMMIFMMYKRNNMDYSLYDFTPITSTSTTSPTAPSSSSSENDPWFKLPSTCIGESCCTSGMIFDPSMNICVVSSNDSNSKNMEYFTLSKYT